MNATPSPRPLLEPRDVRLALPGAELEGALTLPDKAPGLVLFAHGSGSSRHSPRNRYVAEILQAAAARPNRERAVVSRGGRPDLAGEALAHVRAPTLLIVGADDALVIPLNDAALRRLHAPAAMRLVPGASHLFEEPGTLAAASALARDWFVRHLAPEALNDSSSSA
jgi:pimeloyl-ACP methyl ester carboxylesterase